MGQLQAGAHQQLQWLGMDCGCNGMCGNISVQVLGMFVRQALPICSVSVHHFSMPKHDAISLPISTHRIGYDKELGSKSEQQLTT